MEPWYTRARALNEAAGGPLVSYRLLSIPKTIVHVRIKIRS
jgi:hypothetical protein